MILEEEYVEFLIKHNLTQSQFLLLFLVYKNRTDLIKKYKANFPSDDDSMIGQYLIKDLKAKGFLIENKNKGTVELGSKFRNVFVNKHIATDEVFKVYPSYYSKDGMDIPLKGMDRNIFANIYENFIMGSVEEHNKIIEDIKYGKANKLLNIGIEKFLKSKYWLTLRQSRLKNVKKSRIKTAHDNEF